MGEVWTSDPEETALYPTSNSLIRPISLPLSWPMFLIIVLYLNNECATFWQWQLLKPWQEKCSYCLPFSKSLSQALGQGDQLRPSRATTIPFVIQSSIVLSLLLFRNKDTIFMQIKVSWTSMQRLPICSLSHIALWDRNSPYNEICCKWIWKYISQS